MQCQSSLADHQPTIDTQEAVHLPGRHPGAQQQPAPAGPFIAAPSVPAVSPGPQNRRSGRRKRARRALVALLLIVVLAVLLPSLLSTQPEQLTGAAPSSMASLPSSVGRIFLTSSGQLDPTSAQGLNDTVTIDLHRLTPPAQGTSDYAWLLADPTNDAVPPLLLGRLQIVAGKIQARYTHPTHMDLLAVYSRFLVTQQAADEVPTTPSLDPATWKYQGAIPALPAPGDEQQYSFLSHLRHLLAKDPTVEQIGLSGGLDIWLYRNIGKVLEWSTAARDDWAAGNATASLRRGMDRVLDYLDGVNYVWGDVPAGTPFLVDPKAGRIGLLEIDRAQNPPGYLAHVALHLLGLQEAPGHTVAQQQLASRIDHALTLVTSLLKHVHDDAVTLAKMSDAQLHQPSALALLDDLTTQANGAYVGQPDPTTGSIQEGVVWIHAQLQTLASIEVTTATAERP